MIASLRGVILDQGPGGEAVIEVGGVGYRVSVPTGTMATLGPPGAGVFLHVYTQVRDDAIVLFGFATREERRCFEALLGAHGVGPALALAILSALSPSSLRRALLADDVEALTAVPGVGRKTAARLLLDLKAKLDLPEADLGTVVASVGDGGSVRSPLAEVRAALANLGYGADEVRDVVRSLPDEGAVDDLLRSALRHLAAVR